jgi:hypothetical protein
MDGDGNKILKHIPWSRFHLEKLVKKFSTFYET